VHSITISLLPHLTIHLLNTDAFSLLTFPKAKAEKKAKAEAKAKDGFRILLWFYTHHGIH